MTRAAIFDINETTLDLSPVRQVVDDLTGPAGGHTVWFQKLLQLSMTATITENYVDFTTLARAALDAVAEAGGRRLPVDAWDRVATAMGSLVAYPEVHAGLRLLREAGWTTVALTNSALATVETQLAHADLTPLFDLILSVDAVRSYKPARRPLHLRCGTSRRRARRPLDGRLPRLGPRWCTGRGHVDGVRRPSRDVVFAQLPLPRDHGRRLQAPHRPTDSALRIATSWTHRVNPVPST